MTILSIETSCDETAAAVCQDRKILSSTILSQSIHTMFGGVVPEIASREHEKWLSLVVKNALSESGVRMNELDGVAVTRGPGLMGSLLTGVSFAMGFSQGLSIPCIGINHIEAHIFSNFIAYPELKYPFICLLVSGGHTQIWLVNALGNYELLGETRDDAAGEAFDKGARILGLGYPGGPAIEKVSRNGDEDAIPFPQAFLKNEGIEFSFSGLKTSLLNYVSKQGKERVNSRISDIAASYQKAIINVLISKLKQAIDLTGVKFSVIAGGVAANKRLRELAKNELVNYHILFPDLSLCTDNAAMIAFLAEEYLRENTVSPIYLDAVPNLRLVG